MAWKEQSASHGKGRAAGINLLSRLQIPRVAPQSLRRCELPYTDIVIGEEHFSPSRLEAFSIVAPDREASRLLIRVIEEVADACIFLLHGLWGPGSKIVRTETQALRLSRWHAIWR